MTGWKLDASALAVFRQNPEAFRLAYRKHLRAGSSDKADDGSALHVALDTWFMQEQSATRWPKAALRAARGESSDPVVRPPTNRRTIDHLEQVIEGYAARWPRERDNFTVVANEAYVEATILAKGGGFDYCGIIDRKIRWPDGSEYVMDTKTTGRYLTKTFFDPFELSDQMIGYVALERALGRRCDGFLIDAIHIDDRSGLVRPEHFVRHGPVQVPSWRVERWAEDVWWTLRQISDLEQERGVDAPWPVHHNWTFGKPDGFWPVYAAPAELHPTLLTAYEKRVWDPQKVADERTAAKLVSKLGQ